MITLSQLADWLNADENEHLEFKQAKNNFHFDKLVKYCAALANEGGGSIVLGVTDKRPRQVVGTQVFSNLDRTKAGLIERLRLRIEAEAIQHGSDRVIVFTAPSRPIGVPIAVEGAYWMRAGENLAPMTQDMLRRIFAEAGPDFSAEICPKATIADLDPKAIAEFRARWHRKAKNDGLLQLTDQQTLRDAELMTDGGIPYAAVILLGTHAALGKYLAQAEVVFEYRASEAAGPPSQRQDFREGFLLYYDRLWELVNLRNDKQHYQDGLFMLDISTFNEGAIRESILNAVSHRDYRLAGSVFIRQFPRRIVIVSPGGFPQGITPENILDRQQPRNRRIADTLARCGFVDRSGQGANRIYESCIAEAKPLPDFTNTDAWQVSLTLNGQVQDPQFVRFLERIGKETSTSFDTHDFLVLDLVHRNQPIRDELKPNLRRLAELGILESVGRGKGTRYLLSRRFYAAIRQRGTYTRRKGLDRSANKALLLKHIQDSVPDGARMEELRQVLPALNRSQIQVLLRELADQRVIHVEGHTRAARWHSGQKQPDCNQEQAKLQ
jgi:ATP-dependent DNA helicase RecG